MLQTGALASGQPDYPVMAYLALLSSFLLISSTAGESSFACESSTVHPGNGLPFYEVLPSPLNYSTAESICRDRGANLPAFKLNRLVITDPPRIWLSAKRRHWIHGKLRLGFTFEQLVTGQMTTNINSCIAVDSGQLIFQPCTEQLEAICMTYDSVYCVESKYFYDNRCYYRPSWVPKKANFKDAVAACDEVQGYLIEIYSLKQLKWIKSAFSSSSFWSGYSYDADSEEFYWYDGSPVINATWVNGSSGSGDCAVLNEYGEWEHSDCESENPVVCVLDVPYATEPQISCVKEHDECVCYWLVNESKTFHKAMEYCLSDGGTIFYPNNADKLQLVTSLNFTQDLWIGISDGHTRGLFRGADASAITWAVWANNEPNGERGKDCGYFKQAEFYATDCYEEKIFACQSRPDPDLHPCSSETGCLGDADYWIIDDPGLVYMGPAEVVIQNMDTFERCWDTCINYIGFVCLVITYDEQLKECRLSNKTSGVWQDDAYLQSRNRTRDIVDPTSYCFTELSETCTFDEATRKCANYKRGWKISVIRDDEMQQRLGNNRVWISAKSAMPGVYKTHEDEYIPYSHWDIEEPQPDNKECVVNENRYWVTKECSQPTIPSCFAYLDDICRDYPVITNGQVRKDVNSRGVLLTCHDGYYSSNLNATSHYVHCDCNWYENLAEFGNCTVIQCPSPGDSSNGTVIQDNGHGINDTVLYQCRQGKQVAETGLIYFNRSCNWIQNSTLGEWSAYPSFEDLSCGYDFQLENAVFIKYGTSIGSVMEITCRNGYLVYNSTTDTVNSTCILDDNGVIAKWCWVPPCESITCPPPEVNKSGSLVRIFGRKVNETALYRCPYGYQVAETGRVYYNRTCTLIANTTMAEWSDHPQFEALTCNSGVSWIINANVTHFGLSVGSWAQVVCDEGYRVENSTTNTINSTCQIDKLGTTAEWCWVPPCTAIICPEPEFVAMATYIQFGNKTNDNVTYTCQTNYRITGGASNKANATCGYDENFQGVWLQVPQCEVITCDEPPMLANATIEVAAPNRSDIGAMVTYECNENFTLYYENVQLNNTNIFNATCLVDISSYSGAWITNHKCDIPRCGNPPVVENSDFEMTNATLHSLVNYTCPVSYIFDNTGMRWTTSECAMIPGQLLPQWTPVGNCTLVTCDEAPSIPHASLVSSSTNIGDVATYSCDTNYKLANVSSVVKEFQITCVLQDTPLSANWSEPPICEDMLCSSPPDIDNGKVEVRGYRVGETAVYTCDAHYKISGDGAGFGLSITQESECVSDPDEGLIWKNVPICIREDTKVEEKPIIRQCSVPQTVKGASLHYKNTFLNSAVTYVTYSSHVFEFGGRSRSLVCQSDGQWNAKVISPKYKECPILNVTGATMSTTKNTAGTEVIITCIDPKAKLDNGLSKMKVTCTSVLKWTFVPTSCEANRCGPFDVIERSQLLAIDNTVGGLAVIKCDKSSSFESGQVTNSFRCLANLTWEQHGLCLINTCPALSVPRYSTISTNIVLQGTIVDVKCFSGYMFPDGSRMKQVICNSNRNWNTTLPDCEILTCPNPPQTENCKTTKIETVYNTNITYTCIEPYVMENGYKELTIRCEEDAHWTYDSITCDLGRCPPVPEVENAVPDTRLAINTTTVVYSCIRGYVFSDNNTKLYISCNGVGWNITEQACTKVKCLELNLTHATWSQHGNSFGDVVSFTCDEGYHYDNSMTGVLECEDNAQWNGDITGCLPMDCGPPPEMKYSTRSMLSGTVYGAVVTYQCLDNYWLRQGVTNTSAFCTKFGVWTNITEECKPIKCPVVPVWNDMEVNSTNNMVGTTINITCTGGEGNIKTYSLSHCTSQGEWQPPLDVCKVKPKVIRFEPEPEEAKASKSIGAVIMICLMLVFAPIVISDLPTIIQTCKGNKISINTFRIGNRRFLKTFRSK